MNIFRKQFQRNILITALLILLLSIGMAFCAIGTASWIVAQEQIADMEDQYTTVAVPAGSSGDSFSGINGLFGVWSKEQWTPLVEQEEHDYPGLLAEDVRGFLTARVSGCKSVSPYERYKPKDYDRDGFYDSSSWIFDAYNNSMMVLAVRCTSVLDRTNPEEVFDQAIYDDNGEIIGYEKICEKNYMARFALEGVVCRFSGYDTIPADVEIEVISWLYTKDGRIPFEPGKSYLLFGAEGGIYTVDEDFMDITDMEMDGEPYQEAEGVLIECIITDNVLSIGENSLDERNPFFSWHTVKEDEIIAYHTLDEDSLPFCAEYEGAWQDFLESEEGEVWREKIIPWCQLNYESTSVVLTDNIDSLYMFNNGDADVLEGRKFQKEEYTKGDAVCMISADYAMKNNLSVGDVINLDLYQSDMEYMIDFVGSFSADVEVRLVPVWIQNPCVLEDRIGVQKDYTIIGTYTAPEFQPGWHNFQADTIFVPKASIPNAEEYEMLFKVPMYSVILENGMEDEFEAYISDMGFGGQFVYSDQGYQEALESFGVLLENARRLMLVGSGAFLLTALLFFYLVSRQIKQMVLRVRQLGLERKNARRELCLPLMVLILLAVLIGASLGCALYGTVTERALKGEIVLRPWVILSCTAVLALLSLVAAYVYSFQMVNRDLMGSQGKRKRREGKSGGKALQKPFKARQNRKPGGTLLNVTLAAMWRRKKSSFLLITVAAVSVFFTVFVQNLTARQVAAIEQMIRDTNIQCVVTDAHGAGMDYLQMPNAFVEMLTGKRHWQECFVDEYVKNVRAKAAEKLAYPQDVTLRRILSFSSDSSLSAAEGCKIQMLDGWTQEAFLTEEKVCLVPAGMWTRADEDGTSWVDVTLSDGSELELQVIGTVSGGSSGNVIWCPFHIRREEGVSEMFWVDSCSFDIADNTRIEECKAAIYELFVEPGPSEPEKEWTYGVLIQEETYQNTLEKLRSNLFLLRFLLPALLVLCAAIGFLAGYLTTRTRVREFAVMRCLGMKRGEIFGRTFGGNFVLAGIGAVIGGGAGLLVERVVSGGALCQAGGVLAFFLAGAAVSVWNTTRVNVMELMKVEE